MGLAPTDPAMASRAPHVLLVNPWIHDFAAYDFWAKPLGLLQLGALLRQWGIRVSYRDCLDRFHPTAPPARTDGRFGRGPYLKSQISKPSGLEDVPRRFSRYGIFPEWFREDLSRLFPPDLILVTSVMTYWWTGVRETIQVLKEAFPSTPVMLGGIYATLCLEHARLHSGADRVLPGPGGRHALNLAEKLTGRSAASLQSESRFDPDALDTWPPPAFDLQHKRSYVCLLTAVGCPFTCPYCACHLLAPKRMRRSPEAVVEEVRHWHQACGVSDFALYDDAFLVDAKTHAIPILQRTIAMGLPIRFHTPNALHIREITPQIARLLKSAGFETLRLGLETAIPKARERLDHKTTLEEFSQAVAYLLEAGFHGNQVGAYLLAGLPGQDFASVEASIKTVKACGVRPIPAYYSPVPHTALWEKAVRSSRYPLDADPIYTNNALLPCRKEPFSWELVSRLKALCLV